MAKPLLQHAHISISIRACHFPYFFIFVFLCVFFRTAYRSHLFCREGMLIGHSTLKLTVYVSIVRWISELKYEPSSCKCQAIVCHHNKTAVKKTNTGRNCRLFFFTLSLSENRMFVWIKTPFLLRPLFGHISILPPRAHWTFTATLSSNGSVIGSPALNYSRRLFKW